MNTTICGMNNLKNEISEIICGESFVKMILGGKRKKSQEYQKVVIRPVILKKELKYQIEYYYEKKVTHENTEKRDAIEKAMNLIENSFKQINAYTGDEEIQILATKPEKAKILRKENKSCCNKNSNLLNNKTKNYIIKDNKPCDFLIKLKVMSPEGKVYNNYYSKFRQINRFLEILDDTYRYLNADKTDGTETPLRIIDFGCGKAYLTFAVYYYFVKLKKRNVEIIGLDLKKDVIEFCENIARELDYKGLKFICGDIADYTSDSADVVLTLHACDTATDYALINAVNWGAKVILSVPCCQHEMFKQIENTVMKPMLKHGIIKDKFTELLTDGLRGLKLEENGYNVSMIEFTSLEHTSKNIMIKAVKGRKVNKTRTEKAKSEYDKLKKAFEVKPTIDQL